MTFRRSETLEPAPSRARASAVTTAVLFILSLLALNAGLLTVAPEQKVVTGLPFALQGIAGWTAVAGTWHWDETLRHTSPEVGLLRSPLELKTDGVSVHLRLSEGAGLGFLQQQPASLSESHFLYLSNGLLSLGYIDAAGNVVVQAALPLDSTDAQLRLELQKTHYGLFIDHVPVALKLPLYHEAGMLSLLAAGEAEVSGLLVDAAPPDMAKTLAPPQAELGDATLQVLRTLAAFKRTP